MTTLVTAVRARSNLLVPGLLMSIVVAVAATFLADHYHAPVMLFALLLGMRECSTDGSCALCVTPQVSLDAVLVFAASRAWRGRTSDA
jgi:hypothetical protein